MKSTMLTPAVLMAAALFAATTAHAQSAAAPKAYPPGPSAQAWPPGPTAQAYPPGPSGQAAAQTNNVNVVNVPTVTVGNAVTVQEPVREPVFVQKGIDMVDGVKFNDTMHYDVPAGKRLMLETFNASCSSVIAQPVNVGFAPPNLGYYAVSVTLPIVPWGSGSFSAQTVPVHMMVDGGSLTLSAQRPGGGFINCAVTLIGYLTPLP